MIRIVCADIASADACIYRGLYKKASDQRKSRADRYLRPEDKLRCVTAAALLKNLPKSNRRNREKKIKSLKSKLKPRKIELNELLGKANLQGFTIVVKA